MAGIQTEEYLRKGRHFRQRQQWGEKTPGKGSSLVRLKWGARKGGTQEITLGGWNWTLKALQCTMTSALKSCEFGTKAKRKYLAPSMGSNLNEKLNE